MQGQCHGKSILTKTPGGWMDMARFKIETARGVVLCFTSPPLGGRGGGRVQEEEGGGGIHI